MVACTLPLGPQLETLSGHRGSLYSLFREIESRGMTQESIVLACTLAGEAEAAAHLELPPDTELFALERVRLADGEPLAHDCVWLPGGSAHRCCTPTSAIQPSTTSWTDVTSPGPTEVESASPPRTSPRPPLSTST